MYSYVKTLGGLREDVTAHTSPRLERTSDNSEHRVRPIRMGFRRQASRHRQPAGPNEESARQQHSFELLRSARRALCALRQPSTRTARRWCHRTRRVTLTIDFASRSRVIATRDTISPNPQFAPRRIILSRAERRESSRCESSNDFYRNFYCILLRARQFFCFFFFSVSNVHRSAQ